MPPSKILMEIGLSMVSRVLASPFTFTTRDGMGNCLFSRPLLPNHSLDSIIKTC